MQRTLATKNVHQADVLPATEESASRSLRRGLRVLDAVLAGPAHGLRISEICAACGLERATVHRLVATLVDAAYLTQAGRFRYVASPRFLAGRPVAERPPAQAEIANQLLPVLARVTEICGDASFAIMREGLTTSSCVARQIGTHVVQILSVQVGTRQPLGVGAAGLAFLAALPVEETSGTIRSLAQSGELERYGGMTAERLKLLVQSTRERNYALVGNHAARGALGVGIPVLDRKGAPIAAISVAAEIYRMTKIRQHQIVGSMEEALQTAFKPTI